MEKTIDQGPAMKIQDENLSMNFSVNGAAIASSVKDKVSELNKENLNDTIVIKDTKVFGNSESPLFFKEPTEKVSPTLLESAFNVMKTLFSPDKPKSKVSNGVNHQKSVSEPSFNSLHLLNKSKLITSEPEIEIPPMKAPFSEECDLKDKKQVTTPFLSPLDLQSNDDDSFLTTKSYDESFQSAVTHFDENGEMMKNCDSLSNSMFNNSQDLHLADSSNSSLENSECCLENTMLKNDSANSKETNDFLDKNSIENEAFNMAKNINAEVAFCPYQAPVVQVENFQTNGLDSGGFSTLKGELDNCESKVNAEKLINGASTGLDTQELLTIAQSSVCLSKNVEKNQTSAEKMNENFTEMTKINASDKLVIADEKTILHSTPDSIFPQLSESDLREVDEIVSDLSNNSGTVTNLNSSASFVKSLDMENQENVTVRSLSPEISRSDKSQELVNSCSDDFKEIQPSLLKPNKETEKVIESRTLCPKNGLKPPVTNSPIFVSVFKASSNPTCAEVFEKDSDHETIKLFTEGVVNKFPLKHSTPVSVLSNDSCSSMQTHDMNSLEINQRSDEKIHNAACEFLEPSNVLENLNPNYSNSAERISPGNEILNVRSQTSLIECESNKVETLTQILKGNSGLLPSRLNHEIPDQKEDFEDKLNLFNQTFDKKSGSFDSQKLDLKPMDKVPYYEEPDLSFGKKTEKNEVSFNGLNDTYVKESNNGTDPGRDANDVNKISEKNFTLGFISDKGRSELTESEEGDNFLSPIKEIPELVKEAYYASLNESLAEDINDDKRIDGIYFNNENHSFLSESFSPSSTSGNSSMLKSQILASSNQVTGNLSEKLMHLNEVPNEIFKELPETIANCETLRSSELCNFSKNVEPEIAQLIEEQFTPTDIAKICDIANLSGNLSSLSIKENENEIETEAKVKNLLSPKSFDFLNNIQGKPTGRDLSRESLYVKFDPLVQPPNANSLIDFTQEVEALATTETTPPHSTSICEELLAITPEKTSDVIVPPLTPLSDRNKKDKVERQKELQNEIYFLKNLYSERERVNKSKMEEYESQIAKLTGDKCVLEDKLKEYGEREKSLVKKMTAQTHDIEQLKLVMKEYVKVISLLTTELETVRKENAKQMEALTLEKDSYMNHLQNTEAAFSDVHTKYEKSKKTIESLKKNEVMYRNTISEHAQKMEEYKRRTKEAQEKAISEFQNIMLELNESKNSHSQEVSRLRAQLKKTELKLEAVQESLDQKIKENEQLTAICDELIEGKK